MSVRGAAIIMGLLVAVVPAAAKDPAPNPAPNTAAKPNTTTPKASTAKTSTAKSSTAKSSAKAKDDPDSAVEQIARPSTTQLATMGWRIIDDPATGSRLGLPSVL